MCAQPVTGSTTSWMKSSRCRLLPAWPTHAMPRLQVSPACIGTVPVRLVTVNVALPGGSVRFDDCAAYSAHLHGGGYDATFELPAQPPGSALPVGPIGSTVGVRR